MDKENINEKKHLNYNKISRKLADYSSDKEFFISPSF